jgi:hypothetical protein
MKKYGMLYLLITLSCNTHFNHTVEIVNEYSLKTDLLSFCKIEPLLINKFDKLGYTGDDNCTTTHHGIHGKDSRIFTRNFARKNYSQALRFLPVTAGEADWAVVWTSF